MAATGIMEVTTDPIEVLLLFLYSPVLPLMTVLIMLFIAVMLYPALKALRGQWRSWVTAPTGITVTAALAGFGRRRWPYTLLCFGVAPTMMLPTLYFEAVGDEHMRQLWWDLPLFWVPWLLAAVSLFWWPRWATPRWNRDWERRRKDDPKAIAFTDEEIARFEAMPENSKLRRRLLRNVVACHLYAGGHDNDYVR